MEKEWIKVFNTNDEYLGYIREANENQAAVILEHLKNR